jgi:ABC-type transporter Mla subunit MlaD
LKLLRGERLVGVFLLAATGAVVTIGASIASQKHLFEERYIFHTRFHRGHGLSEGSAVYLIDIEAGRVHTIRPYIGPDSRPYVEVAFDVREDFLKYFKEDSIASVSATTVAGEFLGGKVLEVSVGTPASVPLAPGATLLSLDSLEGQAILGRTSLRSLPDDVEALIHHASAILASLNDPNSALRQTLSALDTLETAKLPETAQRVRELVDQFTKPGELQDTIAQAQLLLTRVTDPNSTLGQLMVDDAELYRGIATSMETLNRASAQAETTFGTMNEQTVPELSVSMQELQVSMRDMQKMMGELSNTIVDMNRVLIQAELVLGSFEQTRFVKKRGNNETDE